MDRSAASRVPPSARRAAFFAALAFVLYFSLCPSETVDETFSKPVQSYDWLFHTATYAALGLLLSCLGCLLELGQRLLPFVGRSCSLSDSLHNAFGAALGAFLTPALLLLPRTSP